MFRRMKTLHLFIIFILLECHDFLDALVVKDHPRLKSTNETDSHDDETYALGFSFNQIHNHNRNSRFNQLTATGSAMGGATAWLCNGEEWITTEPKTNWITAVKPDQFVYPNFDTHINRQAICEGLELLEKATGITAPESAAETCSNDSRCTFFSIFYGGPSVTPYNQRFQVVYYCSGSPKIVDQDGWIVSERKRMVAQEKSTTGTNKKELKIMLPQPAAVHSGGGDVEAYRTGSITQDSYYDGAKPGTIVPPRGLLRHQ